VSIRHVDLTAEKELEVSLGVEKIQGILNLNRMKHSAFVF